MRESEFWHKVKFSPAVHAVRIENSVGEGQPDVNLCRRGVHLWLELKVLKGRRLEFRSAQLSWIAKRLVAGGRVYVLARAAAGVVLYHGQVCHGTAESTPVPLAGGKRAVSVHADERFVIRRWSDPVAWNEVEDTLFEA